MKRAMVFVASVVLVVGSVDWAGAQTKKGRPKAAAGAPEAVIYDASSAMAFLATASGEWGSGNAQAEHDHGGSTSEGYRGNWTFKTKALGFAVVQSYNLGTPGEMETVFHLNGDDLVLTHYCALQNAPVLKFQKSSKPGEIKFVFSGGSNFDPMVDQHLHDSTLQIKDKDTIETVNTVWAKGRNSRTRLTVTS